MLCLLVGCQSLLRSDQPALAPLPVQIRFLLTFDNGPSIRAEANPTFSIIEQLAGNDIQPGIKAIFLYRPVMPTVAAPKPVKLSPDGRALNHAAKQE